MNWDRGLKRITLVLSIMGAVGGAGMTYWYPSQVLKHNEFVLRQRRITYSSFVDALTKAKPDERSAAERESIKDLEDSINYWE